MGDGKTDRPDKLADSFRNANGVYVGGEEDRKRLQEMWTRMKRDSWNHMNEIYKRSK